MKWIRGTAVWERPVIRLLKGPRKGEMRAWYKTVILYVEEETDRNSRKHDMFWVSCPLPEQHHLKDTTMFETGEKGRQKWTSPRRRHGAVGMASQPRLPLILQTKQWMVSIHWSYKQLQPLDCVHRVSQNSLCSHFFTQLFKSAYPFRCSLTSDFHLPHT